MSSLLHLAFRRGFQPLFIALVLPAAARAQIVVTPSYTQNFNSIGTALPAGWGIWTDSTATGNGNAFTWSTATVANNATVSSTTYFRNLPGASQTWSAGLSSGTDRAIGWRAGNASSRDGSITFSLTDTAGWDFTSLSFQVFTPNNTGTAATFQLQYQIGASGTFTNFSPAISYTNDTAQNPLVVTTFSFNSSQLAAISNQFSMVTLRLDNTALSGTSFQTVAFDNFSYTASASAIPEPSTYACLMAASVAGIAWWRRRRERKRPRLPRPIPFRARSD